MHGDQGLKNGAGVNSRGFAAGRGCKDRHQLSDGGRNCPAYQRGMGASRNGQASHRVCAKYISVVWRLA